MAEIFDFKSGGKLNLNSGEKNSQREEFGSDNIKESASRDDIEKRLHDSGGYDKIGKIQKTILTENISFSGLGKNKEVVAEYSLEDLIRWIEKSEESNWTRKPEFFKAIAEEILDRIIDAK